MYEKDIDKRGIFLNLYKIINFVLALLVFIVIVDPTNQIFKLKEILFFIVIVLYFLKFQIIKLNSIVLLLILLVFFSFFFSSLLGEILGHNILLEFTMGVLKSYLFLFILLLSNNDKITFFNKLLFPCIIISLITIFTYLTTLIFPAIEILIYNISSSKGSFIMLSRREFVGIEVTQVYYKTSAILVLPLAVYFDKFLFGEKYKVKYLMISLLFVVSLLMSGTRANALSVILIISFLLTIKIRENRVVKFFYLPAIIGGIVCISYILYKIFNDQGEVSLEAKTGHLYSLMNELSSLDTLFLGQGPGAVYYSIALNEYTAQSELSYLEIIRMFGLFGGGIVIILFFFPLYLCYKNKPAYYKSFMLGYLAYLFIGGTNPLLISSTGIVVLAVAYSFCMQTMKIKEPDECYAIT